MDLVKPSQEKPSLVYSSSQADNYEASLEITPKRKQQASSITNEDLDAKFGQPYQVQKENKNEVSLAIDHIFTGKLVDDGICTSIPAEDTF